MVKNEKISQTGVKEGRPLRAGTGGRRRRRGEGERGGGLGWTGAMLPSKGLQVLSGWCLLSTGRAPSPLHSFVWKVQSSEVKFPGTPGTGNDTTLTVLSGYF